MNLNPGIQVALKHIPMGHFLRVLPLHSGSQSHPTKKLLYYNSAVQLSKSPKAPEVYEKKASVCQVKFVLLYITQKESGKWASLSFIVISDA